MAVFVNTYDSFAEREFDEAIAEMVPKARPRDVAREPCKRCGAAIGQPCRSMFGSGVSLTWVHFQEGSE